MTKVTRVDARNVKCPIPALRTRRALRGMTPGELLEVSCTDPMANIDIPCLLFETGDTLIETSESGGVTVLRIRKGA